MIPGYTGEAANGPCRKRNSPPVCLADLGAQSSPGCHSVSETVPFGLRCRLPERRQRRTSDASCVGGTHRHGLQEGRPCRGAASPRCLRVSQLAV